LSIPFTQFLRPHGRQQHIHIACEPDLEAMAMEIIKRGYVFEIEMLQTGQISMEILKHKPDDDPEVIAGEICVNGPPVVENVAKMVREAFQQIMNP
jgi:hypothetical protein